MAKEQFGHSYTISDLWLLWYLAQSQIHRLTLYFTFLSKKLALFVQMVNISDLLFSDVFVSVSNIYGLFQRCTDYSLLPKRYKYFVKTLVGQCITLRFHTLFHPIAKRRDLLVFLPVDIHYGNTGCGVFKRGIQN